MTGRVKTVVAERGFGFVNSDEDHKDYFFHANGLGNCDWAEICDRWEAREKILVDFELVESGRSDGKLRCANTNIREV